jgi:hypothetical protein
MMYGPTAAITPGALQWGAVDTSKPFSSSTGGEIHDPFRTDPTTQAGGRRRRKTKKGGKKSKKSKKGGKKTRKTRKHRMRGGAPVYNAASVGHSFVGGIPNMPGSQTYGNHIGYNPDNAAGNPHAMGADGVMQV